MFENFEKINSMAATDNLDIVPKKKHGHLHGHHHREYINASVSSNSKAYQAFETMSPQHNKRIKLEPLSRGPQTPSANLLNMEAKSITRNGGMVGRGFTQQQEIKKSQL
jgi:hypothetical protein